MAKLNILGIMLDCIDYEEMFRRIDDWIVNKQDRSHSIATVNVNCAVSSLFDKNLNKIYNSADIVGIDSMPFLWLARLLKNRKSTHLCASEIFQVVGKRPRAKPYSFYFFGGMPDAPEKLEQYVVTHFPSVRVVGKYSPPFRTLTSEEDDEICRQINKAQPDIIWVGLGSPKQDNWIYTHRKKIKGSVMIASGAIFDFYSGRIREAPALVRKMGVEWLFRLFSDFRRLWKRYTVFNVIFIVALLLQAFRILSFKKKA